MQRPGSPRLRCISFFSALSPILPPRQFSPSFLIPPEKLMEYAKYTLKFYTAM